MCYGVLACHIAYTHKLLYAVCMQPQQSADAQRKGAYSVMPISDSYGDIAPCADPHPPLLLEFGELWGPDPCPLAQEFVKNFFQLSGRCAVRLLTRSENWLVRCPTCPIFRPGLCATPSFYSFLHQKSKAVNSQRKISQKNSQVEKLFRFFAQLFRCVFFNFFSLQAFSF